MDRGSSVIVKELERELYVPSMVLTEYAKRIAFFEAEGYRPPTIAKMLKSEGIFVSRRGVAKFYREYIHNLHVQYTSKKTFHTAVFNYRRYCVVQTVV